MPSIVQVPSDDLGGVSCSELLQTDDDLCLISVEPCYSYMRGRRLANICWVDHLFETQREHLYKLLVQGLVKKANKLLDVKQDKTLVPF